MEPLDLLYPVDKGDILPQHLRRFRKCITSAPAGCDVRGYISHHLQEYFGSFMHRS